MNDTTDPGPRPPRSPEEHLRATADTVAHALTQWRTVVPRLRRLRAGNQHAAIIELLRDARQSVLAAITTIDDATQHARDAGNTPTGSDVVLHLLQQRLTLSDMYTAADTCLRRITSPHADTPAQPVSHTSTQPPVHAVHRFDHW